jgi:AcrR family transcriptional regulator
MVRAQPSKLTGRSTESSPELSRRERRKLEMRARILEAARELFSEQGFQQTRIAEVCDRADIAQKTLFNHFPTKLDLLRAIAQMGIEELMFEIEGIRKADLGTRERIHRFFDTVAAHITAAGSSTRWRRTSLRPARATVSCSSRSCT